MATPRLSNELKAETLSWLEKAGGNQTLAAKLAGIPRNTFASRLQAAGWAQPVAFKPAYERQRDIVLTDGVMLVCSDGHIWPGAWTPAMNGFVTLVKRLKPRAVVFNGDMLDGARISRHARIGWAESPTLAQELDAVQDFAKAVEIATPKGCGLFYNPGNHCLRYDSYLSNHASEAEGVTKRLPDHFPRWEFQWTLFVNNRAMIKHRHANGVHAGYNNTMKGGVTLVTGHTHQLEVKPWGDYSTQRRWGVQTGTLADLHGPQFEYHENAPSAACSGFAVLTFRDGELLPPELAEVINGRCLFRGEVIA